MPYGEKNETGYKLRKPETKARKGDYVLVKAWRRVKPALTDEPDSCAYAYVIMRVLKANRKGIVTNLAGKEAWEAGLGACKENTLSEQQVKRVLVLKDYSRHEGLESLMDIEHKTLDEAVKAIRAAVGNKDKEGVSNGNS